jgi:hypothetical protein
MPAQPLAVPVQLDALVVNQTVLSRDSFRWWQFNYLSLNHYKSPEPLSLDRSIGGQQRGVYLHWTLPEALRHAAEDPRTGQSAYPLVPNRWLVVRTNGTTKRQVTAWVVESDCPFTSQVTTTTSDQTSMYLVDPALIQLWKNSTDPIRNSVALNPDSASVQVAKIGVAFPLASWRERAAGTMFLTAVAPSNPLFSVYTAHNIGVFSLYDDLKGIDNDTLSYFVLGWYSDPARDVMASWRATKNSKSPYSDVLQRLRWIVNGGDPKEQATSSVYHGCAVSISWARNGPAPANDPLQEIRDSGRLNVGIGNTTIDAFTALVSRQLNDPGKAGLLRAFQYDFLQQLNQVNGKALLDEKVRQAWFGSKPGGYSWTIVANESDGTTATPLTPEEEDWLLRLNQDQTALDAALTRLYSLQWELHSLWLKKGYLSDASNTFPEPPSGIAPPDLATFQSGLSDQLDPARPGSVAAQLVAQFATVQQLRSNVPVPTAAQNPQQALREGIQRFAQDRRLDPAKTLKAKAAPRYWQPNNPVVVVSGVEPAPSTITGADLAVRSTGHLVTGFTVRGTLTGAAAVAGLVAQVPNPKALPSVTSNLLREFFLLDPANAPYIAGSTGQAPIDVTAAMTAHDPAVYQGPLPQLDLGPWRQPWNPMFLEWSTTYSPVPFGSSWTFDGTDYRFTPGHARPPAEQRKVGGISLLSPHASAVFRSRLEAFVQQFGESTELAQIDAWVKQVYDWRFLAQELTGFNELLSLRDVRAFRRPTSADLAGSVPVAALTGYPDGAIPPALALPESDQAQVNTVPFLPNGPAIPFHGTRQGGLYFTDLYLYDKFGRTLFVIQSGTTSGLFDYRNFPLLMDDAFVPDARTTTADVASVVQLPPRLLQHARLDFRLVDSRDDTKVHEIDPDVTPIAGWVLANHLDGSILVHAPDGAALGEFRLVVQADGTRAGEWQPPPHRDITLDDVGAAAPHLRKMLDSPQLRQQDGFLAFLAAIDETLWTTDPLGNRVDQNLSVLVGRPLALLCTRLQFQLDGDPINDTGWATTFKPTPPDFVGFPFAIRLGDQFTREDGLIGYFADGNYDVFNSVASADPAQTYVRPIGPVGDLNGDNYLRLSFTPDTYAYVTVLADPRAAIHATTGVLPVKQLDLPQQFVDKALSAMEISFRMGPVLTLATVSPSEGSTAPKFTDSIVHPLPTEQNGTWTWWEKDAATRTWTGYGLVNASPDARADTEPNSLREGHLQFVTDLDK